MRSILNRLSPSHGTVVAYLALVLALSGTAYAAVTVTGSDIKNGTITARDVKRHTLGTNQLSLDALGSLEGEPGPQVPQGPQGEPGDRGQTGLPGGAGPQGPRGVSGYQIHVSQGHVVSSGVVGRDGVLCPGGTRVLGGGVSSSVPGDMQVMESGPHNGGVGWSATMLNKAPSAKVMYVWAICANVS